MGLSWQTNRTVEDIRCAEGVAVRPFDTLDPSDLFGFSTNALFGDTSVSLDTAHPGYHSIDEYFDYGLLTMPDSESQCSFSPIIRETADEVSALNSQSSFFSNYAVSNVQAPVSSRSLNAFQSANETAVRLQSTPSELSSITEERSSRQSSSSQSNGHISDDNPVGKIRINKHPVSRRRRVTSAKSYTCGACPESFTSKKDLKRHQDHSCGDKGRPFVCTCDRDYKRKDELLRHIKILNTRENNNRHKSKDLVSTPIFS